MKPLIRLAPLLLLALPFLHGEPSSRQTFQVIGLAPEAIYDLAYEEPKENVVRLSASPAEPSRPINLSPGPAITLFREETPPLVPGEKPTPKIRRPLAVIPTAGLVPPLLVLLAPAPSGAPLPYVGKAVSFPHQPGPLNNLRLYNFSRFESAIQIGASPITTLLPGERRDIPYTVEFRAQYLPLKVGAKAPSGSWVGVVDTQRPMEPAIRMLGLIVDATAATAEFHGPINLVLIPDQMPPPDAATAR